MARLFLGRLHCAICNEEVSAVYPESAPEHGFECTCGYRIPEAAAVMEIPEWLAREKHERLGVGW